MHLKAKSKFLIKLAVTFTNPSSPVFFEKLQRFVAPISMKCLTGRLSLTLTHEMTYQIRNAPLLWSAKSAICYMLGPFLGTRKSRNT